MNSIPYSAEAQFGQSAAACSVHRKPSRFPWVISPLAWIALGLVTVYRQCIPARLKRSCIYAPTCSAYAFEAIRLFGGIRGSIYAWQRIQRCNSVMFRGGYDPPSIGITEHQVDAADAAAPHR